MRKHFDYYGKYGLFALSVLFIALGILREEHRVVLNKAINICLSIKELVSNKTFAKEVKSRIGTQIDTTTIDREIKNYESKL